MKMSILVPNINRRGQEDLSFEVRHKVYARPLPARLEKDPGYEIEEIVLSLT